MGPSELRRLKKILDDQALDIDAMNTIIEENYEARPQAGRDPDSPHPARQTDPKRLLRTLHWQVPVRVSSPALVPLTVGSTGGYDFHHPLQIINAVVIVSRHVSFHRSLK